MKTHVLSKFAFLTVVIASFSCRGTRPMDLGYGDGKLKACPESPNCVTSNTEPAKDHYIQPFPSMNPPEKAIEQIAAIIQAMPRTKILKQEPNYLQAEFESLLFRYIDDVEFYVGDDPSVIQVRSASRLGYSDLGANRRRLEEIRQRYQIRLETQNKAN